MNIWDQDEFVFIFKGKQYKITKLDIGAIRDGDDKRGRYIISHKIEGFEVPLYMLIDWQDNSFTFCYKIIEDENYISPLLTLQDEKVFDEACELVEAIDCAYGNR